jgi:cell division septation protein DedD
MGLKKNKKVSVDKKPFFVLSRRGIVGWVGAIFFVCAWMFIIGVLVGRGTAPVRFDVVKIQERLEAFRGDSKKHQREQTQKELGTVKDKTKLDFYEALKENRDDTEIPEKKPSDIISKKIAPLPETAAPQIEEKAETEKPKAPIEIEDKPEPPKTEPAKPPQKETIGAKSNTEPSGKSYTIQAASLRDAKDADRLVAAFKKQGYPAYRMIGKIPGKGIWYRVRIGEYKSKDDARGTLEKLKKAGIQPILVEK